MCPGRRVAGAGSAREHPKLRRKEGTSLGKQQSLASYSPFLVRAPRVPRLCKFGTLEAEICTHGLRAGLFEPRIESRREVTHSNVGWRTHVQVGVQCAARVIGHQNLQLAFRQILDVFVKGACFSRLNINCPTCFLVSFESEELPSLHGQVPSRYTMLRRGPQKIARRFLVAGSQGHGRVWRGGNILLEAATNMHELGKTLHRE